MTFWEPTGLGTSGPDYSDNPTDTAWIGGRQLPGICEVKAAPKLKLDRKKITGANFNRNTTHGVDLGDVQVRVRMWKPSQKRIWDGLMAIYWPQGALRGRSEAYDIYHPDLALVGIKSVIIISPPTSEPGRSSGERVYSLHCVAFDVDRKKTTNTPKGSKVKPPSVVTQFQGQGVITPTPQTVTKPSASRAVTGPGQ